jgi:hypothetical protein
MVGAWFVFPRIEDGKFSLMKVKTNGQATATVLRADVDGEAVPSWSPTGEWILYGTQLVSPDGTKTQALGDHHSLHYVFSRDGKLLYGLRRHGGRQTLFSIELANGTERIIGEISGDLLPGSNLSPGIRLSLAPDGKSFIYATGKFRSNLWTLEGFNPKPTPAFDSGLLRRMLHSRPQE